MDLVGFIHHTPIARKTGAGVSSGALQNLAIGAAALQGGAGGAVLGAVAGSFIKKSADVKKGAAIGAAIGALFGGYFGYEAKQLANGG